MASSQSAAPTCSPSRRGLVSRGLRVSDRWFVAIDPRRVDGTRPDAAATCSSNGSVRPRRASRVLRTTVGLRAPPDGGSARCVRRWVCGCWGSTVSSRRVAAVGQGLASGRPLVAWEEPPQWEQWPSRDRHAYLLSTARLLHDGADPPPSPPGLLDRVGAGEDHREVVERVLLDRRGRLGAGRAPRARVGRTCRRGPRCRGARR